MSVVAGHPSPTLRSARGSIAVVGWTISGAAIAFTAAGIGLMSQNGTGTAAASVALTLVVGSVIGAMVVTRQPRNSVGWILLGLALGGALAWFLWEYGYRALNFGPGWLPVGVIAFWLGSWIWLPVAGAGVPALLVRFPDGHRGSRWVAVDLLGAAGSAAAGLSLALLPGLLDPRVHRANPYGLVGADGLLIGLRWVGYIALAAAISASLAALWYRATRARGDEREQIKWITSAAALVAAALVYGLGRQVLVPEKLFDSLTPFFVSTVTLPAAIGVAILKYRLYDINLVINRTLVYGGLTAMLAGLYTFWVGLTQRLVAFSGQKSDIALLLTAFVGAAAFTPVKSWLQNTVDRRFSVQDPVSVVDSMREQIEGIVNVLDTQRIARRLVEDAAATYQARYVALALGADGESRPFHAVGDSSAAPVLHIVLHSRGHELGVLSLSARRGGAVYTVRDQHALQLCADAVAEAMKLRDVGLNSQL
jgi:hypothetical protein